jgi:serine/threonine protein phosphatase PrpC
VTAHRSDAPLLVGDVADAPERVNDAGLEVTQSVMDLPIAAPFHHGEAVVFSEPRPGKESPNEDSAALIPLNDSVAVLVVADGVGGLPGGTDASGAAVAALRESLRAARGSDLPVRTAVLNGLELANQRVMDLGVGAGTTIAVATLDGDKVRTYHVGDSLVLLVGQRGKRKAETISHSPVGYAVEAGLLDEREAMNHAERHLVSNILGTPEMRIEIGPRRKMAPRDTLILGSDGLFDNLFIDEIVEIIRKGPLTEGARRLMEKCRRRMTGEGAEPRKPDDVTFVVYRRRNGA